MSDLIFDFPTLDLIFDIRFGFLYYGQNISINFDHGHQSFDYNRACWIKFLPICGDLFFIDGLGYERLDDNFRFSNFH